MKRGEITAFLSLLFVLLVSFVLSMTESAMIQTSKNQKRLEVDSAVFSVFGEYQKELLESYEVFAIDGTYESGQFEENQILNRLAYYGSMGIQQEITDLQLLTDNEGQAFREQVVQFMEESSGIALVQELTGFAAKWEEQQVTGQEVSDQLDQALSQSGSSLPEEAGNLLQAKSNGIWSLILPQEFTLSTKAIRSEEQVSVRARNVGRGSLPARSGIGGIEERLLFTQYIMEHFSSSVEKKIEGRSLDYEIEYLLYGKESDEENLRATVSRLLLFRLAMNYMYLMSDAEKQGEAEAMAVAISAVLLQPEAIELIKQLLLLLWSFGESVMDLRSLLSGKKVAFFKSAEDWQLQLNSLFRLGSEEDGMQGADSENGMDYGQYLQILLFLQKDSELTMRTLDRVEQNLKLEQGLEFFRVDACITKMKLQNTAEIWNGCTYTFPTYYGYL